MSVSPMRQKLPEAELRTLLESLFKLRLKSKQGSYCCESFSGDDSKPSKTILITFTEGSRCNLNTNPNFG